MEEVPCMREEAQEQRSEDAVTATPRFSDQRDERQQQEELEGRLVRWMCRQVSKVCQGVNVGACPQMPTGQERGGLETDHRVWHAWQELVCWNNGNKSLTGGRSKGEVFCSRIFSTKKTREKEVTADRDGAQVWALVRMIQENGKTLGNAAEREPMPNKVRGERVWRQVEANSNSPVK